MEKIKAAIVRDGWFLALVVLLGLTLLLTGCASDEAWSLSSSSEALAIQPTGGGANSGTAMPTIYLGGNALVVAKTNSTETKPMISMAYGKTILGQLFGIGANHAAIVYIGAPNETMEETAARLKAFSDAVRAVEGGK